MELHAAPYFLEFRHPFGISSGTRNRTPVVFTRLSCDGLCGYGEASMPPYTGETHESALAFLSAAGRIIKRFSDPLQTDALLDAVDAIAPGNSAAKAAIDIALHDLAGKVQRKPLYELFGTDPAAAPYTVYTIGIGDPALLEEKLQEALPYKILKIKLGSADDKRLVQLIRTYTDKPLVVDVNQGWDDSAFALDMIHWLSERHVLLVEQPLKKKMLDETARLTELSPLPVIADESVQRLEDIARISGAYSGINIKLMKCAGLREARKMIAAARGCGLKVLIGCMSETSCAATAAAHLSPLADWADLDGPLLIRKDYFTGIRFDEGRITLNDLPGTGALPAENLKF
ncbi:MAG: dipeptide epimerase [Bacteroidota bacterium]